MSTRLKSAYQKAIDAAVGTSFDQHVMGGYRFLMRYYHPGDDIYMFGFSRGAYTARFLCEMLDHVGLVVQGNEEMVHFAWKTFSQWQMRAHDSSERGKRKKEEMYNYMRAFRETFTRPVKRVRFLGLFDTVNSVPRFEKAWLKRGSRFPYTARSTARVIRHAVGLDERRAKFRQDLVEKVNLAEISHSLKQGIKDHLEPEKYKDRKKNRKRSWGEKEPSKKGVAKMGLVKAPLIALNGKVGGIKPAGPPDPSLLRMSNGYVPGAEDRPAASLVSLGIHFDREDGDDDDTEQDVEELWFPGCHGDIGGGWDLAPGEPNLSYGPLVWMVREARKAGLTFDERRLRDLGCYTDLQAMYDNEQGETVDESDLIIEIQRATPRNSPPIVEDPEKSMLFNGFGGGQATNGNGHRTYASGHGGPDDEETGDEDESEVYAIRLPPQNTPMPDFYHSEGRNPFDLVFANFREKLKRPPPQQDPIHTGSTHSSSRNVDSPGHPLSATPPRAPRRPEVDGQTTNRLVDAFTKGRIHCCLTFGGGLPPMSTLGWRMMEYLPFRRMDLQPDGSWKAITWPLPRGEVRDVPDDAKIHGSVLVRMKADEGYRPGNLLVGGGGRGVRVAPEEYGTGEWVVLREEGSLVGEVLMKKSSFRPKVEGLRK